MNNVEATGRRCLTCGKPVTAHAEEYVHEEESVKEVRAQKVQAHPTGRAVRDERPRRKMCGG